MTDIAIAGALGTIHMKDAQNGGYISLTREWA